MIRMGVQNEIQAIRKKMIEAKDKISIIGVRLGWKSAVTWLSEAQQSYNAILQLRSRKDTHPETIKKAREQLKFCLEKAEAEIAAAEITLRKAGQDTKSLKNKI